MSVSVLHQQHQPPSPSRARLGSAEASFAHDQQQMLAKMQRALDELRSRYSAERKELLAAASDHVADGRAEMEQTKQLASRCIQRVDAFRRQLRALEAAALSGATAQSDVQIRAALTTGSERLAHALDGLRESTEQTQLLQSAILNDRVRREARMRQARDEDAELELRIRHLEESNAVLRAELAAVKAVNAEAFKSVGRVLEVCRPDASSAIHGSELKSVHLSAVSELAEVREALTVALGRVESIDNFTKKEDARRNGLLEQLESVVKEIERRPPPPIFAPKIQTRQIFEAQQEAAEMEAAAAAVEARRPTPASSTGTYPAVAPRYDLPATPLMSLSMSSLPAASGAGARRPPHLSSSTPAAAPSSSSFDDPVAKSGLASFFGGGAAAAAAATPHNKSTAHPTSTPAADHTNDDPSLAARRRAAAQLRAHAAARDGGSEDKHPQGSAFTAVPGSPTHSGAVPSLRNRIMAFYSKYKPEKLSDVDRIMAEYKGAEEELLSSLEVHYNAFGYFSQDLEF